MKEWYHQVWDSGHCHAYIGGSLHKILIEQINHVETVL